MHDDPYRHSRFVEAQENFYEQALAELRRGKKHTHWIWFVFPQLDGMGSSSTARFYAIRSIEEAAAYLQHPTLGPRLVECCEALIAVQGKTATEILGFPDDLKLRSSLTLFSTISPPDSAFTPVIEQNFKGEAEPRTIELLAGTT